MAEFGVTGAPETFIIAKRGIIRKRIVGAITDQVWKRDVEKLVRELEAEPWSAPETSDS